jgi:hypothetical protein
VCVDRRNNIRDDSWEAQRLTFEHDGPCIPFGGWEEISKRVIAANQAKGGEPLDDGAKANKAIDEWVKAHPDNVETVRKCFECRIHEDCEGVHLQDCPALAPEARQQFCRACARCGWECDVAQSLHECDGTDMPRTEAEQRAVVNEILNREIEDTQHSRITGDKETAPLGRCGQWSEAWDRIRRRR